jgi:hypothetical protein
MFRGYSRGMAEEDPDQIPAIDTAPAIPDEPASEDADTIVPIETLTEWRTFRPRWSDDSHDPD